MDEIFKEEDIEKDESTTNVACETTCYCGVNGVPWVGTYCTSTDCSERREPVTKGQQALSENITLREISKTIRKQFGESYKGTSKVEDHIALIKDDSTCSCSDELCETEESGNESTVCKCRKVFPWIEITCDSPTCLNEKKQESLMEISFPKDQLFPAVVSACVCGSPYPWLSITCPPHSCTKSASAVMIKIDEQCICGKTPSWIETICPSKACTAQVNKKPIQNEIKKSACICDDSTINSICRTYACALKTQIGCVCEIAKPPKTGCRFTKICLIKRIMKLWSNYQSRRATDLSCVCKTAGMSESSNCRSKRCPFNTTSRTSFRPRLYNIPLTDINCPIDISTSTCVCAQDGISILVSCKSPDCNTRMVQINDSKCEVIEEFFTRSQSSAGCVCKDCSSQVACSSRECQNKMDIVYHTGIPCSTCICEHEGSSLEVSCKSPECKKRTETGSKDFAFPVEFTEYETDMGTPCEKVNNTSTPYSTCVCEHDDSSLEVSCKSPDCRKRTEIRYSASRESKDSMLPVESSEYPTKMDTISDEVITTGIPCSTCVCEHDGASLEVSCKSPDCIKRTVEIDNSTEAKFLRTGIPCTTSDSGHDDSSLEVSYKSPDSEKKQEERNDSKNERIIESASVSGYSASCECKDSILPIEFWEYPIKMATTESTVHNTVIPCSKCACPDVGSSSKISPNCKTRPVRIDDPTGGSMKQSPSKISSLARCGSMNFTVDVQTPEYSIKIGTTGATGVLGSTRDCAYDGVSLQITSKSSHSEKKMLEIKDSQCGISKESCSKSRSKDDGFSLEVLYKSLDCEERTIEDTNSKCRMIENQSSSGCIIKNSVTSGQCSEYPLKIDAGRVTDYPAGSSCSILLCSKNGTSLEEASASSPNKITVEIVGYSCETKDESALTSRSARCSSKNSVSSVDSPAREFSPKEMVDAATDSRMSDKPQSPKEVTFVTPEDLTNNVESSEDIIDSETGSLD